MSVDFRNLPSNLLQFSCKVKIVFFISNSASDFWKEDAIILYLLLRGPPTVKNTIDFDVSKDTIPTI